MQSARPVGRQAATRKYDLLTAMGAMACGQDKHQQRLVLRFITLIVARYNWQNDDLSIGQREIAALWSVDERTVKRELAKLRALGWLVLKRGAARGRVAVHGLDLAAIWRATEPAWAAVGPDFVERMRGPEDATPRPVGNVLPFPGAQPPSRDAENSLWSRAQSRLYREDPALYAAWFQKLEETSLGGGHLELTAPSAFVATFVTTHLLLRLVGAVRAEDATVRRVTVLA